MNENYLEDRSFTVDPKQSSIRLDKFLHEKIEKSTRSKIQSAIKEGLVSVNGSFEKANYRVLPNDHIVIKWPKKRFSETGIIAEKIPLEIVFEDEHILIVNKAAGMVVHPGVGNHSGTLVNALAYYMSDVKLPIKVGNLNDRPGLVHRIDKDTSGLLVIAKDEYSMSHLSQQFLDHSIYRSYIALVWGSPNPPEGSIQLPIGRHPKNRIQQSILPIDKGGKEATTHYQNIQDLYYVSLVRCQLETGRTHQIRVHMANMGNPLFNDSKYGGDRVVKGTMFSKYKKFVENTFNFIPRHALHAQDLGFIHPHTREYMSFSVNMPTDMMECLERWESYLSSRKEQW